uniref:Zinc finger protein, FOG family member 1 n=1 Tax=Oryzias latipes TaxID=8090 RepID=A0A3P9L316_ORYLA
MWHIRLQQLKPKKVYLYFALSSAGSLGDLDGGEENTADTMSLSGEEGGVSDPEDSAEGDSSTPPPYTPLCSEGEGEQRPVQVWEKSVLGSSMVAMRDLHPETLWGPYLGVIQSEGSNSGLTLVCESQDCWISRLPLTSDASAANCTIYSQSEELFCKVTAEIAHGEKLLAFLSPPQRSSSPSSSSSQMTGVSPPLSLVTQKQVKEEPLYPAALCSEIQLLPQQAGMAAILATAVVNKDIFPCKDCGIWFRSERNLQAHLMYYCASRQKQPAAASSPPQDKPKESYPNERICPFPQCNKSCPSASSLEIHMRTHSGERPFVCLICLSAFTTKANCERHLKVHTDILNGVCHGCGFVSTTRDILYSHLVTSHMVCQPGSRSEVYSPGPGLSPGDSGVVLKCQVCGHNSDSPAHLQQHVRTHLEVRVPAERSPTPRQSTPSSFEHPQPSPQEREPLACVPKPESSSPGANGGSATPRDYSSPDSHPTELRIKEEPQSEPENEERNMETSNSPKSPTTNVKAEPTSPTPGSSPAHLGGSGTIVPGGTLFLPQYMFNPEVAILPQASEILAKMSEMVHSRLKQGQAVVQNNPAAFFPSGATAATATATPPHKGATCFECDITFNNINNFYAHKRLYCSSRHQGEASGSAPTAPSTAHSSESQSLSPQVGASSRAASASPAGSDVPTGSGAPDTKTVVEVKTENPVGKEGVSSSSEGEGVGGERASEDSQSPVSASTEDPEDDPNKTFCEACNIRFSRHENYTVHKRFYCASRHDPTNHRSAHAAKATNSASFLPQPIRTRKRKKMYEIHMARTEALANAAAAAAAAAAATAAASAPSSPEGDGPIDLSKRPRLSEASRHSSGGGILPALPLSDYHKCTACSISFNSIENYLAHKTYYCPATTLQPHTLEQLHRLKRSASTSPKNRPGQERPDLLTPIAASSGAGTKGTGSSLVVCPYCPNRPITCDLMEHLKTTHGLVVSVQLPKEAPPQPGAPSRSPSLSPASITPTGQPKGTPRVHRDSINGQARSGTTSPVSPMLNGSPSGGGRSPSAGSPLPVSPLRAPSLTVSPVPEALRERVVSPHILEKTTPPAVSHPAPLPKTSVISPIQNGNSRFCRLCNIKFSSLSTFIAHKKYYCSSHSAEHVK